MERAPATPSPPSPLRKEETEASTPPGSQIPVTSEWPGKMDLFHYPPGRAMEPALRVAALLSLAIPNSTGFLAEAADALPFSQAEMPCRRPPRKGAVRIGRGRENP